MTQSTDALPGTGLSNLKGMLWLLCAALLFSTMHSLIREVSSGVHPFEIAFFRTFFGLVALIPVFLKQGLEPFRTTRPGLLAWRAVINSVAMALFFYSISVTPLADVTALSFTAPIFVTILAIPILGERVGLTRWAAIAIGFAGALVIIRPGFQAVGVGTAAVLISAVLWATALIIIKILSRTESSLTITTYMGVMMTPLTLIPALFVWTWPSWEHLGILAGIGAMGSVAMYCLAEGLRNGDTHVVMPVDYTRLIWMALAGYLFFQEIPTVFTWIGGLMIAGSASFIAWREGQANRPVKTASVPPPESR